MFHLLFVGFLVSLTLPLVQAYSSPGACSGACWAHDPSVVQRESDGKYFKFNTGSGMEIASASSLSGPWTILGHVLPKGTTIQFSQTTDLWAPDVSLVDGVYHLYYAVSTFGSQTSAIGLATSSTMEANSWTDKGSIGLTSSSSNPYNAIDPNLIKIGSSYSLNFGSFWHDIYQIPLNAAATRISSTATTNIEYDATGSHPCEGSFMFYNSGYYYLLWSRGICCGYDTSKPAAGAEYKIMMCRSTSASSGFLDQSGKACTSSGGTVLLESHGNVYGPGGQGVFDDTSLGFVLYYHYADPTVGLGDGRYKFGWNVLNWSNGWPSV